MKSKFSSIFAAQNLESSDILTILPNKKGLTEMTYETLKNIDTVRHFEAKRGFLRLLLF